jgi:uncharacterized membrane protein
MITVPRSPRNVHRLRDFALYIAIGLCVAIIAIGLVQTEISHDSFMRWGGLAVNTSVLFGYFIVDSRILFGRMPFWALTIVLLLVHVIVFTVVLMHVSEWKLIWFTVMLLEVPVLLFLRNRFLNVSTR